MNDWQGDLNGIIREITEKDVEAICQIEQECFPADEAATPEQIKYRFKEARELFLAYEMHGQIIAFIGGLRSDSSGVTSQSMHVHAPNGQTLCIHSVCVKSQFRRKGIALKLLHHYVTSYVKQNISGLSVIALICRDYLIPFYEKAGFKCIGLSSVVHGQLPWHECQIIL